MQQDFTEAREADVLAHVFRALSGSIPLVVAVENAGSALQGSRLPRCGTLLVHVRAQGCLLSQLADVFPLFASTSLVVWAISLALCRSKSNSDGVNIRGAGEVPSF